jgi:hypothetical protein
MFTRTRNPSYVGGSIVLLGIAIGFALDWVLLILVPSLLLVHYGILLGPCAQLSSSSDAVVIPASGKIL